MKSYVVYKVHNIESNVVEEIRRKNNSEWKREKAI